MTTEVLSCGHAPTADRGCGTGYGEFNGQRFCYDCCATRERDAMIETGRACLYLVGQDGKQELTDWPGRLRFPVQRAKNSRHNIGRTRVDVWFIGPDGREWHGACIGDMTLTRCKRKKA